MKYWIFYHMKTRKRFYTALCDEREMFLERELSAACQGIESISIRIYDAKTFNARCSHIVQIGSVHSDDCRVAAECIVSSRLFLDDYFDVVDIVPSLGTAKNIQRASDTH